MAPRYLSKEVLDSRENDILDHANNLIHTEGFGFLTMDKLVSSVSYSKGTVYNHFTSKEDVFVALCNRCMHEKISLFIKASNVDASARYKMLAVCFSFVLSTLLNPSNFVLMICTTTESFDNASQERVDQYMQLNDTLRELCNSIIEEAIKNKELTLSPEISIDEASLMVYAMILGSIGVFLKKDVFDCPHSCILLEQLIISHMNTVMDGLNWQKPEEDQQAFIQMMKETIFPEEIEALQSRNIGLSE